MIHLYAGDGKGKTTAAVGLAVRMAGSGKQVLFGQFLKNGHSNEIGGLDYIPNIHLFLPKQFFGFTFRMDSKVKEQARQYYGNYFQELKNQAGNGYELFVLDEVVGACNAGLLEEEELIEFLQQNRNTMEFVLTGRNPSKNLEYLADYYTVMEKRKHPYDNGVKARVGIEK